MEVFLSASLDNKLPLVDKYLTDGGNPDVVDHVSPQTHRYIDTQKPKLMARQSSTGDVEGDVLSVPDLLTS